MPPLPGAEVRRAHGVPSATRRCTSTGWNASCRSGSAATARRCTPNLDFIDGTRGAHVNISGHLRRRDQDDATRPSCSTRCSTRACSATTPTNTHALIFNVKGEDLLFLDHDNTRLDDAQRDQLPRARADARARSSRSTVYAPPRKGDPNAKPDVATRTQGVHSFYWTIAEFVEDDLLPFVFADAEDDRQQYTMVVHNVGAALRRYGEAADDGGWRVDGQTLRTYRDLVDFVVAKVDRRARAPRLGRRGDRASARSTRSCAGCCRRSARSTASSAPTSPSGKHHRIETDDAQVTVVDLHNLPDRAKRFVVGVTLRRAFDRKEQTRRSPSRCCSSCSTSSNKYAPRDGDSPIKEILLDVAERGRSLGIVLIGAQQTASEVERRIIANSSIRVVGRLDPAEATRPEYGFLPDDPSEAGDDRQAGHDVRDAARDPAAARRRVPLPGLGDAAVRERRQQPRATGAAAVPDDPLRRRSPGLAR